MGLSVAFNKEETTLMHLSIAKGINNPLAQFEQIKSISFVNSSSGKEAAIKALRQYKTDMLIIDNNTYWINTESAKGKLLAHIIESQTVEKNTLPMLKNQQSNSAWQRKTLAEKEVRYVDWVIPGVLGMNMMFSCLFGVGYVIVRYRTSGILKRYQATPVTAFQFLLAQVLSRLVVTLSITCGIFIACMFVLDLTVKGNLFAMLVVAAVGALSMIALGLIASVRTNSLELSNGLLNIFTWPMLLMSSVWFSFDDAPPWLQWLAQGLPLTHLLKAERAIMLDGETLLQQWLPLSAMAVSGLFFLLVSSALFRWGDE